MNRRLRSMLMMALAVAALGGCTSSGMTPERRHAELEWALRRRMPTWSAREWNAWEAELAAALNEPVPTPPMLTTDESDAAKPGDAHEQR